MSGDLCIGPALPHERNAAFRQAFGYLPAADRELRAAAGERMIAAGEMQPDGVLVARRDGAVVGAEVCLMLPGAAAMLWPPQTAPAAADRQAVEDALVAHAVAWMRARGAKIGQVLLMPSEQDVAAPVLRNGFAHVTQLWYLRHELAAALPPADAATVTFRPYPTDADRFHQTLLRTYECTQDCPEISGARTLEEILAGHRGQGRYDPNRWWLALHGDDSVGVLLLNDLGDSEGWDVSYTGVVPEARQRGFGRQILQHALAETARGQGKQLSLAVDVRNTPAWRLYHQAGFRPYDRREVYLAVWRKAE